MDELAKVREAFTNWAKYQEGEAAWKHTGGLSACAIDEHLHDARVYRIAAACIDVAAKQRAKERASDGDPYSVALAEYWDALGALDALLAEGGK